MSHHEQSKRADRAEMLRGERTDRTEILRGIRHLLKVVKHMDEAQKQLQTDVVALKEAVALVPPFLANLQSQLSAALANQPDDSALQEMDSDVKDMAASLLTAIAPVADPAVAKSAARLTTVNALEPSKHPRRRG